MFQVFGIGSGGGEVDATVLKKEEEALITLMKERAVKRCRDSQRAYYECVKPRTISIVWACREQANTMNDCLHDHTSEEVLAELKARWVRAGNPLSQIATRSVFADGPTTKNHHGCGDDDSEACCA